MALLTVNSYSLETNGTYTLTSTDTVSSGSITTSPTSTTVYEFIGSDITIIGTVLVPTGQVSFRSVSVSSSSIHAGDPVTVSYEVSNAISLTADFVNGLPICLGTNSFVIYPDKTTTYTLRATGLDGNTINYSFTINVAPQTNTVSYSNPAQPSISYITIDGTAATTIKQEENTHVLEIFGSGFMSGANPQIVFEYTGTFDGVFGINDVTVYSVSDSYIRCTVDCHAYTQSGVYNVRVVNGSGISPQNSSVSQIYVKPTFPQFIMPSIVSVYPGEQIDLYLDYVDTVRDKNLKIVVNGVSYNPIVIGENLTTEDFIDGLYEQLLGRLPTSSELSSYMASVTDGAMTLREVYQQVASSSPNPNKLISVGTLVTVMLGNVTTGGLSLTTVNGTGDTAIQLVAEAVPPAKITGNQLTISGVNPTFGITGDVISIFGTDFSVNTQIYLGSTNVAATFVSSEEIQFTVPTTTNSYVTSIVLFDGTQSYTYSQFNVVRTDPFVDESVVIETLFADVDAAEEITTISNPANGSTGDTGQSGTYLSQPTYNVEVTGLADLTIDSSLPVYGSYQPDAGYLVTTAEFTTTSINGVVQKDPQTITVGVVNHVDLSPNVG